MDQQTPETVYFVHISDTHIGPDLTYTRHGYPSWPNANRLVDLINTLPYRPDFVIHTGDVVTDPHPVSYRYAAELFERLEVPVYFVVGNHDEADDMKSTLPMGPITPLVDNPHRLAYRFDVKGQRFMVLDGRAPDEMDPRGVLTDDQFAAVQEELERETDMPLTVFIHFPLFEMQSPWIDQNMLLINGERLHSLLATRPERVRGVFHGHIHMPVAQIRDGIFYSGAPSPFANFDTWPNLEGARLGDAAPGYSFVHSTPDQTVVHQHAFAFTRPEDNPSDSTD